MAYTSNIPQAADRFRDSQPLILGNFIDIASGFNLNHVDFNMGINTGKHKFLQMPVQGSAPTTAPGPEMGLYAKQGSISTVPEIFIRRNNDGVEIPLTETNAAQSYSFLGSGLVMKWLKGVSVPLVGNNTLNLPADPAKFTAIRSIQITITGVLTTGGIVYISGENLVPATQTLTINCSVAGLIVGILVIGSI